jgi:hypothetical protein
MAMRTSWCAGAAAWSEAGSCRCAITNRLLLGCDITALRGPAGMLIVYTYVLDQKPAARNWLHAHTQGFYDEVCF